MDPGQLLTFLAIHDAGGFNRASMTLHKSQPALSRTVHQLEDAIGAKVFLRNASGIQITDEGRLLLEHARQIRDTIRSAEAGLAANKAAKRTELSIGVSSIHPLDQFAKALADLAHDNPRTAARLIVGSDSDLLSAVREGGLDLAILPMPSTRELADLKAEPIFFDHAAVSVYCRAGHPLADLASPSIADLSGASWIMGFPGSIFRDRLDALFDAAKVRRPRIALEVDDARARSTFVLKSDMVSIFPLHAVKALVDSKDLVAIPFPLWDNPQPLAAVCAEGNEAFRQKFAEYLRRHHQHDE
ncbi:LysR family transcriptional regulator [Sphingobium lactosutens]|uniref:HTH lysR-type domain-containing protein n=1 Tax=Sphingobium lactosutens DS20 TaxID=1331060 RepID=T0IJ93_9SPHN|nr:LysR substrate-binding domain-containing protein [Sphingobium lactosutens]EQB11795.1 hypothetical protein RLDS_21950 [Sphingobium lactosutens DS20]